VKVTAGVLIVGFTRRLHASKTSHHIATHYRAMGDGEHTTVTAPVTR
jgi:hypothetical protein